MQRQFYLRLWLLFSVLLALSACSVLQPAPAGPLEARNYAPRIELSGRLSARYTENRQPQATQVNFTWAQSEQQTVITLDTLTRQTVATIYIDAQGARFVQADKPVRYASNSDELFTEMLGWPLPIVGLRDWLQGYIDADHHIALTAATSGTVFHVDGWDVRYASWLTENNHERPKRIDLSRQTEQAGLVTLRIALDDWNEK